MNNPVQITFRNMDPSRALTSIIEERASKLEHYWNRIIGCRVALEAPRHHLNGYHVRLELSVPGKDIVIGKDPATGLAHMDVYAAVNQVFETAKRQLLRYAQKRKPGIRRRRAARRQEKLGTLSFSGDGVSVGPESAPWIHAS